MKKAILTTVILLTLAACAEERPPAQNLAEGYNAHQMQQDVWEVKVNGTGHPVDKVQRMALWRAAKLTLDQKADRFQIIGGDGVQSQVQHTGQVGGAQIVQITGAGPQTTVTTTAYSPPFDNYVTQSGGDILIKIYANSEAGPAVAPYDARQIMQMYGAEFAGMK